VRLAGQHKTVQLSDGTQVRVVFDQRGFPVFDDIASFDTRLPSDVAGRQSNLPHLAAGAVFQLELHPLSEHNRSYLLLEVRHQGRQPQVLEEYAGTEGSHYHNEFITLPADQPYRPPFRPKPYAFSQTAVVVGPPGEQVYTDEFGNIQVRFHWDREGQNSCWLRVTQAWAGSFWGSKILPRVGQEVVVDFINGDPDQPIVTGCLYHGLHKPPYPLPEHKSKTLIRSHSLSGQDGHELLLEDKAEQEKIAVHSAGDLELHVTQDSKTAIDRDQHTLVQGNSTQTVKGSQHLIVQGERRTRTGGQHSLDIGQAQHLKAGTALHLQSGQDLHLKAGIKAALSAGIEVVLKAGASSLVLNPAGVFVNGPAMNLTGGGMAGAAVGARQAPLPTPHPHTAGQPPASPHAAPAADPARPRRPDKVTLPRQYPPAGQRSRFRQSRHESRHADTTPYSWHHRGGYCLPTTKGPWSNGRKAMSPIPITRMISAWWL